MSTELQCLDIGDHDALPPANSDEASAVARLPPETMEAIIDCLRFDTVTLTLCSTVCRFCVPATRRHIFRKVTLNFINCNDFLEILNSPYSTIAPHVRDLTLSSPSTTWMHDTFLQLSALTRVESLALLFFRFPSRNIVPESAQLQINADLRGILVSHFKNIRTFAVGYAWLSFQSLEQWEDFLRSFRHLERITLGECRFVLPDAQMDAAINEEPLPSVRFVSLTEIDWTDVRYVNNMLRNLGPSVENLHLGMNGETIRTGEVAFLDLSHNTHLRTIHFTDPEFSTFLPDWIYRALRTVCAPVSEINIRFSLIWSSDKLYQANWAGIAAVLSDSPQFSCYLRKLRVSLRAIDDRATERAVSYMQDKMFQLRDKLEFHRAGLSVYPSHGLLWRIHI